MLRSMFYYFLLQFIHIFIWLTLKEHLRYFICHDNCFIYNPLMFTHNFFLVCIYLLYVFIYLIFTIYVVVLMKEYIKHCEYYKYIMFYIK